MATMRNLLARALRKAGNLVDSEGAGFADVSTDYVNWLCFANAGMLHRGNLFLIDTAMRSLTSPAPILEIGAFCGLSTNVLLHYKKKYGRRNPLINCDPWDFERTGPSSGPVLPDSSVTFEEYRQFVKETYLRNVRRFSAGDLPCTLECTSEQFFQAWRRCEVASGLFGENAQLGGPLSFCYIDGNHSYEFARTDFTNCDEFLDKGGFLLFDDSAVGLPFEGVRRVVNEVERCGRYELVAKNPNHLFRKL